MRAIFQNRAAPFTIFFFSKTFVQYVTFGYGHIKGGRQKTYFCMEKNKRTKTYNNERKMDTAQIYLEIPDMEWLTDGENSDSLWQLINFGKTVKLILYKFQKSVYVIIVLISFRFSLKE